MSDPWRMSGRVAAATALAALLAAIFRLPQPFLAVLGAFIVIADTTFSPARICVFLAAAWGGVLGGVLLISGLPQQPWVVVPVFIGLVAGACRLPSWKHGFPHALTVLGLCASLPAGLSHPAAAIQGGWAHGLSLTMALLSSAAVLLVLPHRACESPPHSALLPYPNALAAGLASGAALLGAAVLLPGAEVITVIAAATTALRLETPGAPSALPQKAAGAVLGAVLAGVFDTVVTGAGNDITIFLATLAFVFGLLTLIGTWRPALSACMAQAGALFAVAAPLLPSPADSLAGGGFRTQAVLLGFASAAGIHLMAAAFYRVVERASGDESTAG